MNRTRSSEPLTVAELVRCGPLARAGSFATRHQDRPVTGVSLISELEKAQRCEPNTALVVHPAAAHGIWALESVLRHAWERNASCVVAPAEIAVTSSTIQLAERLRIPLFTVADPAQQALELAAAIADTEAARARLMARCAVLFGEHGRLRDIVGVINTEVPGVSAALVTEDGHVLAGRSAAGRPDNEAYRVRVAVPGPDGRPWAALVAQLAAWSPSWVETVETILRLARAPLVASVAGLRLSLAQQASKDRLLLETLLRGSHSVPGANGAKAPSGDDGTNDPEQLAREAGWRVEGNHVAVALRPADPDVSVFEAAVPVVVTAWQEAFPYAPIVPRGNRWVAWFTDEGMEPREVAEQVRRKWASARVPIRLAVGIGRVGEGMDGIRRSVGEAELAAAAAGQLGGGPIELYAELGPRAVLACLPVADVATAARVLLADLIADPKADVLITTLATLLDCGGSTGQAAARLGLHRNTMLGRIERIRACGVDLESPDQRLALHVACYTLLNT
ncbi:PucR family transcriptional regulator [Streptomyces sp. NPDC019443]|uniref:PucR family transcriptional regulator n=1 Tax=Streptomyces sp. NPDC019443 TaxID=3365061 RepID=UPI0037A8057D